MMTDLSYDVINIPAEESVEEYRRRNPSKMNAARLVLHKGRVVKSPYGCSMDMFEDDD